MPPDADQTTPRVQPTGQQAEHLETAPGEHSPAESADRLDPRQQRVVDCGIGHHDACRTGVCNGPPQLYDLAILEIGSQFYQNRFPRSLFATSDEVDRRAPLL